MDRLQDTSPDTKRKKEFVLGFYVSANEFSDSRIVNLTREHGPLGYTVFSCARCLMRGVAELKLSLSDASKDVAWLLHSDADVVDTILDHCTAVGLFSSDGVFIWCDEMIEDVARLDKRRQQLIEAGSKGGSAKAKLQAKSKHKLKHTPVRYGTVRNGTIDDLNKEELPLVNIPHEDEIKLQSEITADELEYWRQALTEYAKIHPAKWRKYKDHASVIRSWRRARIEQGFAWDSDKKTYQKVNGYLSAQDQRAKRNKEFLEKLSRGEDV